MSIHRSYPQTNARNLPHCNEFRLRRGPMVAHAPVPAKRRLFRLEVQVSRRPVRVSATNMRRFLTIRPWAPQRRVHLARLISLLFSRSRNPVRLSGRPEGAVCSTLRVWGGLPCQAGSATHRLITPTTSSGQPPDRFYGAEVAPAELNYQSGVSGRSCL
jgi:hypothetical protein